MREIYLRPFEAAVKEGGTWGIMSSYNRLNGTYTAENEWLLNTVLREDWGYDGIVMSDWFGSRSTAPTVNAGLDLEMPGPTRDRGQKLIAAVEAGDVSRDTVRTRALNMLKLMERCGALHDTRPFEERAEDRPETRTLIRKAGAEGMVMLKNDGDVLPLSGKTVAVIGPNAVEARIMGGGSAQLNPHYAITPEQGLISRLGAENVVSAQGCTNHRFEPLLKGDLTVDYFANTDLSGEPVFQEKWDEAHTFWAIGIAEGKVEPGNFSARLSTDYVPEDGGLHRVGVCAAGYARVFVDGKLVADAGQEVWKRGRTFFEEGCDEVVGEVELTAGQAHKIEVEFVTNTPANLIHWAIRVGIGRPLGDADIARAAELAASAENAVVVVGRSGEWDTEGWDMEDITLPGRQDELVRAVLAANPNTVVVVQAGGPVEMPWINEASAVLMAWYGGQEAGNSITDVLYGAVEPTGRLPQTFPMRIEDSPTHSQDPLTYPGLDGRVRYSEGLYIGYRHYDRNAIVPLFPFGYGLSYTDFELDTLRVDGNDVRVTVQNIGKKDGTTVVQLYVSDRSGTIDRPDKELKAFAKVHLAEGETRELTFSLSDRDFAHWNNGWHVAAGQYDIHLGFSAADIRLTENVERVANQVS